MGAIKFGPARIPSRESPEEAIELLQERGYSACEIDFEGKFWMDYDFAQRLGEFAREHGIVLSVHAPIAGFMGHAERGKKLNMAVGMLDHSAGIAKAAGAELVVFHPGFLLERTREAALDSVCEQLGELRERLEGKDRAVPFGVEVMGRVRDLVLTAELPQELSQHLQRLRPMAAQVGAFQARVCLAQKRLGLVGLPLRGAYDPERHRRGRERGQILRTDRRARLEGDAFGLGQLALLHEQLSEPTLALAERGTVLQGSEDADGLAEGALGAV